ncbi:MAG TPA: hypothetical protein PLS50_03295 [Candidatus Dojkabacteria bacterium]|nr:hypothetical protein [Candidatus Dojkabacteria bacterium]
MNKIIKFIERDEIVSRFPEFHSQHLLGFFQKSEGYVVYCSIIQEDDGTFEYYFNDNRNWMHSIVPENNFKTFHECKDAMMYEITGLSCEMPTFWGVCVSQVTKDNEIAWKALNIEGEYPGYYHGFILNM